MMYIGIQASVTHFLLHFFLILTWRSSGFLSIFKRAILKPSFKPPMRKQNWVDKFNGSWNALTRINEYIPRIHNFKFLHAEFFRDTSTHHLTLILPLTPIETTSARSSIITTQPSAVVHHSNSITNRRQPWFNTRRWTMMDHHQELKQHHACLSLAASPHPRQQQMMTMMDWHLLPARQLPTHHTKRWPQHGAHLNDGLPPAQAGSHMPRSTHHHYRSFLSTATLASDCRWWQTYFLHELFCWFTCALAEVAPIGCLFCATFEE